MYPTINGWTKSKMIEQIYRFNNGKKAVNHSNGLDLGCLYRDKTNNRCAVGCFIPDLPEFGLALKATEGVHDLLNAFPKLGDHFPLSPEAMSKLQRSHDYCGTALDVRAVLKSWIEENVEDSESA